MVNADIIEYSCKSKPNTRIMDPMVLVYIIVNKLSKSHPRYAIQQNANSVHNMVFNNSVVGMNNQL